MKLQRLGINRRARAAAVVLALGLGGMAVDSYAQTSPQTATLSVTASVPSVCTISTSPLAFGNYNSVTGEAVNGTGTVSVTCTNGSAATVTLGQGANFDTGSTDAIPLRRMTDGSHFLSYQLYSDSGRTTVWGNTAPTGEAHTGTGTLTALTVYGRINASQNAFAGSYTDSVVATITF